MRDARGICRGKSGGVPGNENRILVCDYCHARLLETRADAGGAAVNEPTLLTCGICGEKSRPIHSVMDCIDELRAQVAAAEERGRRRGIEETVKRAIQLFPDTAHDNNGWIREFITALAPRDSAPSRGHPADCLCVGCVLDESKAPRDSGKVET